MTLKPTVRLKGLQPQAVVAMLAAEAVYRHNGLALVVTSCNDSQHGTGSLHYAGRAIDCRLPSRCEAQPGLPAPTAFDLALDTRVARDLKEALGPEFDVILETHQQDRQNWHIHVEYDPKF